MVVTGILNVIGALGAITKARIKGLKYTEIKRTSKDHPDYSIINSQNTEKSSGEKNAQYEKCKKRNSGIKKIYLITKALELFEKRKIPVLWNIRSDHPEKEEKMEKYETRSLEEWESFWKSNSAAEV